MREQRKTLDVGVEVPAVLLAAERSNPAPDFRTVESVRTIGMSWKRGAMSRFHSPPCIRRSDVTVSATESVRVKPRSRRELQNLPHLRRPIDPPRIARHPKGGVPIACSAIRSNASGPTFTAPRLRGMPSPAMNASSTSAGVLARMVHRRRHQRLAFGVRRLVPAHHRRQHDAGRVPVRDVEHRAQHVADAVAGTHRHAARQRPHRQPGAQLAIQPRLQIATDPPSPAAVRAPAAPVRATPAHRRTDAPRSSRCPRRSDPPRGCRWTGTATPACAR